MHQQTFSYTKLKRFLFNVKYMPAVYTYTMPRTKCKSKDQRRKQQSEYMRRARQQETSEDREMRRAKDKVAKQVSRTQETVDNCSTRRKSMRVKMQKIRAQETEEDRTN